MATFANFSEILPDPNNQIGQAGQADSSVTTAPGFSSVELASIQPIATDVVNSGRSFSRAILGHSWEVNIKYNPLTRTQFLPVYSFLIGRSGALNPFFVALPQYLTSGNATFTTAQQNVTSRSHANAVRIPAVSGGATMINVSNAPADGSTPAPGDIFRVVDTQNTLHTKLYMVTRVETSSTYNTSFTGSITHFRLHFTPRLSYAVTSGSTGYLDFRSPLMRVAQSGETLSYSLGINNLYQFNIKVKEVLP